MRGLAVAILTLALAGGASAELKERVASISVLGHLVCAHCELGVGDGCCTGIKVDNTIFVIEGESAEELFDMRRSDELKVVGGTLKIKEGVAYLNARKAGDPKKKNAEPRVRVHGKLDKGSKGLFIKNGRYAIAVAGKGADSLTGLVGKEVRVDGTLSVSTKSEIVLTATKGSEYTPKKTKTEKAN